METRHSLNVTGNGTSSGGVFKDIKIVGDAQFQGSVDCMSFRCTGTARVSGDLKSTSFGLSGNLDMDGDLDTGKATVNGRLEVGGNVKAQEIKSNGETTIRGHVAGEQIQMEGTFHIKGRCEAETLGIKGMFRIGGLVTADLVHIGMHSRCTAHEIGGERIEVRRAEGTMLKKLIGSFFLPADFYEGTLDAETIEGDDVYVEYTNAKVVRGKHVTLGPGCRIQQVEYTHEFHNEAGSTVAEAIKTGHGLE
ncbi:polymer-forming cytoskeletal protein [Paenibacillus filicis]|uniref:Polymer-forming cytoskeletal protein n=2 Tax=Paenibacillus filicis TaxID=669464 RepID=A0ABU9DRG1_9BACL